MGERGRLGRLAVTAATLAFAVEAAVVSGIQEGEEIALQPSLAAAVIH